MGARWLWLPLTNIELQQLPQPDPTEQVSAFGWRFAPAGQGDAGGTTTRRSVFNGDVGPRLETNRCRCSELDGALSPPGNPRSSDGREVTYGCG